MASKRAVFNRIFHRKKRLHFMDKKGTLLILTKRYLFLPKITYKSPDETHILYILY